MGARLASRGHQLSRVVALRDEWLWAAGAVSDQFGIDASISGMVDILIKDAIKSDFLQFIIVPK